MPSHVGLEQFVPTLNCYTKKKYPRDLIRCKYPTWALNRLKTKNNYIYSNIQAHNIYMDNNTSTINRNNNQATTVTSTWWYLILRFSAKVSESTLVVRYASRSTLRVIKSSEVS